MEIKEDCVWLNAYYAESFTGSGNSSKQNRVKESGLMSTKTDGWPSLHTLMGKKISFKTLPKRIDSSLQHDYIEPQIHPGSTYEDVIYPFKNVTEFVVLVLELKALQ